MASVIADYEQLELLSRDACYDGWVPGQADLASTATLLSNIEQHLI